jgi:hypothetical protein
MTLALAAGPDGRSKTARADERSDAQEALKALRELRDAVRADRRIGVQADAAILKPAKVATSPTLDSAGLDALLDASF